MPMPCLLGTADNRLGVLGQDLRVLHFSSALSSLSYMGCLSVYLCCRTLGPQLSLARTPWYLSVPFLSFLPSTAQYGSAAVVGMLVEDRNPLPFTISAPPPSPSPGPLCIHAEGPAWPLPALLSPPCPQIHFLWLYWLPHSLNHHTLPCLSLCTCFLPHGILIICISGTFFRLQLSCHLREPP